jgi:hypothetical protein
VACGNKGIDLSAAAGFYTALATGERIYNINFPVGHMTISITQLGTSETVDVSVYGSNT